MVLAPDHSSESQRDHSGDSVRYVPRRIDESDEEFSRRLDEMLDDHKREIRAEINRACRPFFIVLGILFFGGIAGLLFIRFGVR